MISIGDKSRLATLLWFILFGGVCLAADIQGKVAVQGIKSPASIVVYIDAIPDRNFDPPAEHAVVHQKNMTFIPHVLGALKGTAVDFRNEDPVNHGVSWPAISGNRKLAHHLGFWPQGEMKSFTFTDLGVVPLLCYLHPEMSGYVIVVPTPYFAVTDNEGDFAIKDVPSGTYTLKTWSEEGEHLSQPVQVSDALTTINLAIRRAHSR